MSTPLTLTVGDITLTYETMQMVMDHGALFQEDDRVRRRHPYIDYEFHEQHPELDLAQSETCFCRKLGSMVPRLDLLGHSLSAAKADYERQCLREREEHVGGGDSSEEAEAEHLTFEEFVEFVRAHAVNELSDEFDADYEAAIAQAQGRIAGDPVIPLLPKGDSFRDRGGYSQRSHFGALITFMHPYNTLRVLAENPANLNLDVVWDYGKFVDAGWAKYEYFVPGVRRTQTFMIATEGSTDANILRRAFSLLRPEIEDFFTFIDVKGGHPFSGTSSLSKFAEGLVKIDVQNLVIILFDNDAEGCDAFRGLLKRCTFPPNMSAMVLPDIDSLRDFPAQGPSGVVNTNINGCAASIECYLDLRLKGRPAAKVRWTNYKESLDVYQGSLEFKDSYTKAFLKTKPKDIAAGAYDASKLQVVLTEIYKLCRDMAT